MACDPDASESGGMGGTPTDPCSGWLSTFYFRLKCPNSVISIRLSPPRTPFIAIHFPSCCANGVWLSHGIKKDIKLYNIIFPLSLHTRALLFSSVSFKEGNRFTLTQSWTIETVNPQTHPIIILYMTLPRQWTTEASEALEGDSQHMQPCLWTLFIWVTGTKGSTSWSIIDNSNPSPLVKALELLGGQIFTALG